MSDNNDVLAAIKLQTRYRLSFWDAMIVQSANVLGCDIIWTEDLSHGQRINQTVSQNPFNKE
jgi:predicted nucleic acid-binding protein